MCNHDSTCLFPVSGEVGYLLSITFPKVRGWVFFGFIFYFSFYWQRWERELSNLAASSSCSTLDHHVSDQMANIKCLEVCTNNEFYLEEFSHEVLF